MTTKSVILKAIRTKCLDCCVGSVSEVKKCTVQTCGIYPYRFGVDPSPSRSGFAKNPSPKRGVFDGKAANGSCPSPDSFPPENREGQPND